MKLVLLFTCVLILVGMKSLFWDPSRNPYRILEILFFFPTVLAIARGYGAPNKRIETHIGQVISLTTASSLAFSLICLTALYPIAYDGIDLSILMSSIVLLVSITLGYSTGIAVGKLAPTNWVNWLEVSLGLMLLIRDAFFLIITGIFSSIFYIYGCKGIDSGSQMVLVTICVYYLLYATLAWGLFSIITNSRSDMSLFELPKRSIIICLLSVLFILNYVVNIVSSRMHYYAVESGSEEMVAATSFLPSITIDTLVASSVRSPSQIKKLAFAMMAQYYSANSYEKMLIVRRLLDLISGHNDLAYSTPLVNCLLNANIDTNGELVRILIRNDLLSEDVLSSIYYSTTYNQDYIAAIEMSYSSDTRVVFNSVKLMELFLSDASGKQKLLLERRLIGIQNNSESQPVY